MRRTKIPDIRKISILWVTTIFLTLVYAGHKDCKDRYLISSSTEAGRKLKKISKMEFSIRA